ncbi:2OG-Fe(II) oxygenase [Thalassomonas actiniarum]|uniref:2OG-Fe(II) oxygenase n=1 Tax=Thalassomonas actiniarum TaxID=485447 RepID=A0AAE9YQK1_9GAMM|nr:2OG-Fe(II) oxygenase family protein [Thalassomonas actiniarum]WDD97742.1 2OG-Fe(II) oxygenase [Thalassomonas actiniarum]
MHWEKQLNKNGYVQIKNFLPEAQALSFRKKILAAKHHKTWDLLTTPYRPLMSIKDILTSSTVDKRRHQQAVKALQRRQFSFSFYRTGNKHEKAHGSGDIHRTFCQLLQQKVNEPLALDGEVTDTFLALFMKGQFINYHSDKGAGKYAFIYQLSKGWQHKYGGQLELYPKRIKFYKKSLQPEFNSLVLLKIDHPMYHSVRVLNNPAHKQRITISGWLV